jgi:drug/metabolite transporter (DMT)-like permease
VVTNRVDLPFRAVGFYVGNLVVMVVISALVKLLSVRYPVSQILFFRFMFAVLPLFVLAAFTLGILSIKTSRYRDHAIRSVSGVLALSLFFSAISLIPMAEATMISYSSPIFITLLSIPILSEKIGWWRWFAVLLGFVGVVIVAQPGSAVFSLGSLFAIGSAMLAAVVVVWLRLLSDTENPIITSIIYNSLGAVIFSIWALTIGWIAVESLADWALLIAVGLSASVQQFLFASSFRYGEASLLAPFEYLILIFSAVVGYVFWDEVPVLTSIFGGIIIAVSGLVILARTRKANSISTQD